MKSTIVAGMLGAGKTTFISNYLRERREKVVVLVNDFGKLGIDGEIISSDGYECIELPSGCVCCTLKYDFVTTIGKVRNELSPEHLIIEPSGVASPSAVIEALELSGIRNVSVVLVVDINEFLEVHEAEMYGRFFEDQVRYADLVLLNKADLSDSEKIGKCREIISEWNPLALILESKYGRISSEIPEGREKSLNDHSEGDSHIHCETIALILGAEPLDFNLVYAFYNDLNASSYGKIIRAKGLFITDRGNYRMDVAGGRVSAEPFGGDLHESRFVLIGEGIDEEGVRSRAQGIKDA
jgi:G3E family GTPase